MPYQSKTYSLSNEVIAAIEAAREQGLTPNKYLRYLIGLNGKDGETIRIAVKAKNTVNATARREPLPTLNDIHARLDATGPELSSGRGKASTETYSRGPRQKGDKTR